MELEKYLGKVSAREGNGAGWEGGSCCVSYRSSQSLGESLLSVGEGMLFPWTILSPFLLYSSQHRVHCMTLTPVPSFCFTEETRGVGKGELSVVHRHFSRLATLMSPQNTTFYSHTPPFTS